MQQFESFRSTFEDGAQAADSILELIVEIQPDLKPRCDEFLSNSELQPVLDWLRHRAGERTFPCVEGFLSRLIKPTQLDGSIITIFGADRFIENQAETAPLCNLPEEWRFCQFAYWTGDLCDGDAWCFDFEEQMLSCLTPGAPDESLQALRLSAYAVLPALDYLAPYLRTSATRRGWISKPNDSLQP